MAFIDDIVIHLKAGDGGHGVVRWRAEKGKPKAGAAGGNGGHGGSVFLHAIRDIGVLVRYATEKKFSAENGLSGMKKSMDGRGGKDLHLDIPLGSIVTNMTTGDVYQFLKDGEEICVLDGGRGGLGNEYFKSSTNVTPLQQTDGKKGQEADFHIELQLIVDAGFAGFPNAGKSSLLNALTNARAKVASYQFTKIEPNIGDFRNAVQLGGTVRALQDDVVDERAMQVERACGVARQIAHDQRLNRRKSDKIIAPLCFFCDGLFHVPRLRGIRHHPDGIFVTDEQNIFAGILCI